MSLLKSKQLFKRLGLMVLLLLSAVLVLVGCDKKVKLSFEEETYTVAHGDTLELMPEVKGKDVELVYSSENEKIATYEDGKVKGIAVGKTKVRVEVKDQEDIFAEVEVEVIKPDAYKITYHLDGGTNHKDNPATYDGEKPIFLQPAIKDGFEFDGWYTSSDFTGAPVNMIFSGSSGNKELFAKWTPIYNITYELYGGTNDEENPETYMKSNKDIELKPAVKEGFEFLGWFDNDKFEGEAVTKIAANATGHLTLHANFKEIVTYEITYELDGGTNNAKNPAGFNFLDLPITLEDPFKRGYTFEGWYDNADFEGEKITQLTKEEDITLYAKFVIVEYKFTYEVGEGTNPEDAPTKYTVNDLPLVLPIPTRVGSAFGGWYTNPEFDGLPLHELDEEFELKDLKLYAYWVAQNTFEVKYVLEGGENAVDNPEEFDNALVIELEDPVREHFTFAGWYDNPKFDGEKLEKIIPGRYGVITLYAKWEPVKYKINFELDGGELAPIYADRDEVVADFLADYNAWGHTNYTLETLPMGAWGNLDIDDFLFEPEYRTKWTWLVSYFVTTTAGTEANAIIKDFFNYETVAEYTAAGGNHAYILTWEVRAFLQGIQYNPSVWWPTPDYSKEEIGNGFWDFLPVEETYTFDQSIMLPLAKKEGHIFIGWFTDEEFTGQPVLSIPEGQSDEKTFYAKYIEHKTYEITYHLDGGTNHEDNPEEFDNAKATPLLNPTKEGHHFLGWYSDAEFKNKVSSIPAKLEEGFAVYAKWMKIETFNITYHLNDGLNNPENKVVYVNNVATSLLAPSRFGYAFIGWFNNPELEGAAVTTIPFGATGDKVFYAKWELREFTVDYILDGGYWRHPNDSSQAGFVDEFMKDFYAFVNPDVDFATFVHGEGKTTGYDGLWHSVHKAKIYDGPRPEAADETKLFFIYQPEYFDKWMPFFDFIEAKVKETNPGQSFWGGTWTGLIRFREYMVGERYAGEFPDYSNSVRKFKMADEDITITGTPKKASMVFAGWYDNPEFTGEPLTVIKTGTSQNLKLYAKWNADEGYIQDVIDQIDALPTAEDFEIADKAELDRVFAIFNTLDEAGKEKITNADKLTALYDKYDEIIQGLIDAAKTIEEVIAADEGDAVSTIGIVTAINGNNVTIQDGDHAIYLYLASNDEFADLLKVGNKVFVRGARDNFYGLRQIGNVDLVLLISKDNALPTATLVRDITKEEELLKLQGQLINLMNMTVKSKPETIGTAGYNVVIVDMAGNEITLRVDSEKVLGKAVRDAINKAINGFAIHERININAGVLGWYNGAQVMITEAAQLVKPVLLDDFKASEALKHAKLPEGGEVYVDFKLPTTSIYGAKITWRSDNNVILVDGADAKVTRKAGDVNVKLYYQLTVGTETLKGYVDFVVVDEATVTESLVYSTGFEDATEKGSYATGEMTADGEKWSLTEAVRGTLDNDKKEGTWSIRGRSEGNATMLFGYKNVSKLSFKYARYGTITGGLLSVEISKDGETWVEIMEPTAGPEELEEVILNIDYENQLLVDAGITKDSTVQFRFVFGGPVGNNSRMNLDEVKVYSLV